MTITVEAPGRDFRLTPRIVAAVAHEEGLVLEAYKDSVGVWTFGLGMATTGGYDVLRYKDKPVPIEEAVRLSIDAMRRDHAVCDWLYPRFLGLVVGGRVAAKFSPTAHCDS